MLACCKVDDPILDLDESGLPDEMRSYYLQFVVLKDLATRLDSNTRVKTFGPALSGQLRDLHDSAPTFDHEQSSGLNKLADACATKLSEPTCKFPDKADTLKLLKAMSAARTKPRPAPAAGPEKAGP